MPVSDSQEKMLSTLGARSALRSISSCCLSSGDFSLSVKASPSKRRCYPTKYLEGSQKRPKTLPSNLSQSYSFSDVYEPNKWSVITDSYDAVDSLSSISPLADLSNFLESDSRLPDLVYVRSELSELLSKEKEFHPNIDFLFKVDPDRENKVNAAMRDEAVFNLRFLHLYFQLSTTTFVQAVSLIDRFIVKVKVKPKYMACVATACYHIAAMNHEENYPSAEELVHFSRCGGTANDLIKMEQIIKSKPVGPKAVTTLDFLQALVGNNPIPESLLAQLQVALCSVYIHTYRPVTIAFALLNNYNRQRAMHETFNPSKLNESYLPANRRLKRLLKMCQLSWTDVTDCTQYLQKSCDSFYARSLPSSHRQMVWALSKRTLINLSCSSPPALVTITEDEADSQNTLDKEAKKAERCKNKGKIGRLLPMDESEETLLIEASNSSKSVDVEEEDVEAWLSRLFEETWETEPEKSHS